MAVISGNTQNTYPTPAPSTTPTTTETPKTDKQKISQTFDQFLSLLTTQLKYQDPTSPMDSAQFTNQLVSFSQVEQQIKTNDNLAKMISYANASQTTLGLSYIGLKVDMQGSNFKYFGNGTSAEFSYNLPAEASKIDINIIDSNNNVVRSFEGEMTTGAHKLVWDGTDENGDAVPAGNYKLLIGALDKEQKAMTVPTTVPGRVEGIQTGDDGEIMLLINNQEVPMSSITKATL